MKTKSNHKLIENLLNEVEETLNDDTRVTSDVQGKFGEVMNSLLKSEAFGAGISGAGLAAGGLAGVGLLSVLGTAGLSAAGVTSGLAAAGAIVGGGMVAGIGVLAAPAVILGGAGYVVTSKIRHKKVIQEKEALIQRIIVAHEKIVRKLESQNESNNERIMHLKLMLEMLMGAKKDLEDEVNGKK